MTLHVVRQTLRESSLDGQVEWFDPTVVASSTLPVREAVDEGSGSTGSAAADPADSGSTS